MRRVRLLLLGALPIVVSFIYLLLQDRYYDDLRLIGLLQVGILYLVTCFLIGYGSKTNSRSLIEALVYSFFFGIISVMMFGLSYFISQNINDFGVYPSYIYLVPFSAWLDMFGIIDYAYDYSIYSLFALIPISIMYALGYRYASGNMKNGRTLFQDITRRINLLRATTKVVAGVVIVLSILTTTFITMNVEKTQYDLVPANASHWEVKDGYISRNGNLYMFNRGAVIYTGQDSFRTRTIEHRYYFESTDKDRDPYIISEGTQSSSGQFVFENGSDEFGTSSMSFDYPTEESSYDTSKLYYELSYEVDKEKRLDIIELDLVKN